MLNPENLPNNEIELTLLRSDLMELFQEHSDKIAIHQPDDLSKPAEIVIGGTYQQPGNENAEIIEVHVRQRLDNLGTNYLIIVGSHMNYSWSQVADTFASSIYQGETPLASEDIEAIRRLLQPHTTNWSNEDTQKWLTVNRLFELADSYAKRTK